MSALPLVVEGGALSAVIVGGGHVALRRAGALLEAGARVRVVARAILPAFHALAGAPHEGRLELVEGEYAAEHLGDALLVIAATDDAEVNARVARDARARSRLVTVADAPALGNCVTPAAHRSGDLLVAVTTGGVPGAAARIRDAVAARFDARYAAAVRELAQLRRRLLDEGRRDRWRAAAEALVGDDFCDVVERGELPARVAQWR